MSKSSPTRGQKRSRPQDEPVQQPPRRSARLEQRQDDGPVYGPENFDIGEQCNYCGSIPNPTALSPNPKQLPQNPGRPSFTPVWLSRPTISSPPSPDSLTMMTGRTGAGESSSGPNGAGPPPPRENQCLSSRRPTNILSPSRSASSENKESIPSCPITTFGPTSSRSSNSITRRCYLQARTASSWN